ncbi:MAG: chromate transporter [Treponema sp.]|nr:chromate transporter [Candidatus Treponema equi]
MGFFKKLLELYITFFKIGSITFGGGLTMLPILERELIDNKHWTSSEELLDYYAIAQSTPGIIAVNVSTFVGHKQGGIPGAIAATLGMVSPSIIIIVLVAEFISNFNTIPWVRKAMRGINVGVAALLTYSLINLTKKTVKNLWCFILYGTSFVSVYFFHIRTVFVILCAVAVGLFVYFIKRRKTEAVE